MPSPLRPPSAWRQVLIAGAVLVVAFAERPARAQASYVLFESGPVRPVALSPNGQKLFVANTPDAHLEVFDVGPGGLLTPAGSVAVGLEPVAVAARDDGEVWVVNHLSDSVSIVDVASDPPRVARTLLVGDEPRDVVFAGAPLRAFVSTAHRGQHRTDPSLAAVPGAGDPQLTTPGIGRADVWVFDAATPGSALGGVPVEILSFFADTPRALATDGTNVYVAAFQSGNQTAVIAAGDVPNGFATACGPDGEGLGVPGPSTDAAGNPAPETGVIVRFDGTDWVDALGCTWNAFVSFSLPDHDVFAFDANTLAAGPVFDHVGTILFGLTVNPVSGRVYAANLHLPSHIRFEGPGQFGGTTVQGRFSQARISVLDPAVSSVDPQPLNPHIDYAALHTDAGADHAAIDAQIPHSLATPLQLVVSPGPDPKVYVAAFGSAKIGVIDAALLEDPLFETGFDPTQASAAYIPTGGGPSGLALNVAGDRLYVTTRFDHAVSVIDVGGAVATTLQTVRLSHAEPASVTEGRPFLYDAVATSGNGEASCAGCHVFGDGDGLAWNLGDPDASPKSNPMVVIGEDPVAPDFHPMKGPMTTQTLRGLSTHGGMHWRGDRTNGAFNPSPAPCSVANAGDCGAEVSFDNFIEAFEGLNGRHGTIADADMQAFTDFALQIMLPPSPIANLDGSETPAQAAGRLHFFTDESDGFGACQECHTLDPAQGFYGATGVQVFSGASQQMKVAPLRNLYAKVGMFGLPGVTGFLGDQVRGVGFRHNGSFDTVFNFIDARAFQVTSEQAAEIEQFLLAFPTDLAPVVGQQVSIGPGSPGSFDSLDVTSRIQLLRNAAREPFDSFVLGGSVTECDLVVHTLEGGAPRSYVRREDGRFHPDDAGPSLRGAELRAKADPAGDAQDLVYLCVPPGSGERMGMDRDQDGVPNALDNCPAWPNGAALGTCTAGDAAQLASRCTASAGCGEGGTCSLVQEDGDADGAGDACEISLLPEPGAAEQLASGAALLVALWRARTRRLRGARRGW